LGGISIPVFVVDEHWSVFLWEQGVVDWVVHVPGRSSLAFGWGGTATVSEGVDVLVVLFLDKVDFFLLLLGLLLPEGFDLVEGCALIHAVTFLSAEKADVVSD